MLHQRLFVATAVLTTVFGVPLILAPDALTSLYGLPLDTAARGLARMLGASLIVLGAVAWSMRRLDAGPIVRTLCNGFAAGNAVAVLANVYVNINGIANALSWANPAIYAALGSDDVMRLTRGED